LLPLAGRRAPVRRRLPRPGALPRRDAQLARRPLRRGVRGAGVVIHHVFANRTNVGDLLSARGIQALLHPEPVTEHLCDDPFVESTLAALAGAAPDDVVVVGGGGLFMDYFEPFWRGLLDVLGERPLCIWG